MQIGPVIFVAHGAPTLAIDEVKGADLAAWGQQLPRPRAILVISAHWVAPTATLGSRNHQALIYDFYGFPPPLYQLQYPASGAADLADQISALLEKSGRPISHETTRGLDHGAWVPLRRLFPEADIPVLQLAQPAPLMPAELFQLGQQLSPLRDEGVLIMTSGSLTHNFNEVDFSERSPPPQWAVEFDRWTRQVIEQKNWQALINAPESAPHFSRAHPSTEHFSPLWLAAGASRPDDQIKFVIEGFEFGSVSRLSIQFG